MGNALIRVIRLWFFLLAEQLLLFPITCIFYSLSAIHSMFAFVALYLVIDLIAMLAREFLPKRFRPWILIAGLLFGNALVFLSSPNLFFRIAMPFILGLILWHGVHMVEMGFPGPVFTSFILLGFILYPIVTWVFQHSSKYHALIPVLAYTGTAGILLSLILVNRQQIREAGSVLERRLHLPGTLLRKNAIYVAVFLFLAVGGAAWEFFGRLVTALFGLVGKLIQGILWLLSLLNPASEEGQAPPPAQSPDTMVPMDGATPLWMEILQNVILGLVVAGFLYLLGWGVYRLIKKLIPRIKPTIQFVLGWIRQFFAGNQMHAAEDPGFVDEVESLLKQNESSFAAARRWLSERMDLEPGYGSMKTDAERIRWLYRNLVRREIRHGFDYQPASTPQETLAAIASFQPSKRRLQHPHQVGATYGDARYSDRVSGPEQVAAMKRELSNPD